ncbi:unnamed protein product [Malus baccata var. baccata]
MRTPLLLLIDETQEGVNAKLNLWREVLESKGFRLSRSKTEYMECKFSVNGGQNELGVRIGDQEIPNNDPEMRMLRWMCGPTRKDKIRNEDIRGKVGVAKIEGNMRENRLRWFGHVQRRPTDAPVRRCDYGTEVQGRRGRGRPRKTLEETLRKDLEYLDLTEDMTQNRAQWRSRIHIADPT